MDKKNNNIRLVKNGGRRVTGGDYTPENDELSGSELLKRKISYQKRQKERRIQKKRRRTFLVIVACIIIVLILLFLTPIFNIRTISVDGNEAVSDEQIVERLRPLIGQNLLRTGNGKIENMLKEISYIQDVNVQKRLFPPSVELTVIEYSPAAIVRSGGKNYVISSNLRVLDELQTSTGSLPVITGVEIERADIGYDCEIKSGKGDTLRIMLQTLEKTELIHNVSEINMTSLTAITMNYDDRLTVQCGSQLDMEMKIRMFREAVTREELSNNAHGTVDLSETGNAIYIP